VSGGSIRAGEVGVAGGAAVAAAEGAATRSAATVATRAPRSWRLLTLEVAAVGALLAMHVALAGAAARAAGRTADEAAHLSYGMQFLERGTFARGDNAHDSTMPVSVLYALAVRAETREPAAGEVAEIVAEEDRSAAPAAPGALAPGGPDAGSAGPPRGRRGPVSEGAIAEARRVGIALTVLLLLVVYAWAREAWGRPAGLVALAFAACCPQLLAHGPLVTTDLPLALGVTAALWTWWRWQQRPGWGRLAGFALVFGLAQLTKGTAVFLLPILGLAGWWGARRRPDGGPGLRSVALALLCAAVVALLVINLGFAGEGNGTALAAQPLVSKRFTALAGSPLGGLPLPLPVPFVQGLDLVSRDLERPRWTYCLGRHSDHGFPEYYTVAVATKSTLAMLALLGCAVWSLRRGGSATAADRVLLVGAGFLFVYLSFFYHYQLGLRHLLALYPLLYVWAARAARPVTGGRWRYGLLALLLLAQAATTLRAAPWYLPYFHELVPRERAWELLADSNLDWGQADRHLRREVLPQRPELLVAPREPVAGRILVRVAELVGHHPGAARRFAWLRECGRASEAVAGGAYVVFAVEAEALARCAAASRSPADPGPVDEPPPDGARPAR
jgi:4-amino-4-deoxy-L-arabinose transferase-like glycosyltransferase